jgi:meso-butanediol dehydrogenase/(S,S)-butanediol dehydrogenase/diacetyl reductase
MTSLNNRVAVVTGGAQGLGAGMVRRLVTDGARVAIVDLNGEKAEAFAAEIRSQGHEAIGVQADVGSREHVQKMVAAVVASFGKIDVLFNNAGFNKPLPFFDVSDDNFNSIMRVNALGVMICMQECGKQMIKQGTGGKIINTASIAGRQGYPEFAPYCASKAAVISLTQAAARELGKHKITVNGIAPGVVVTPLWDGLEQDMIDKGVIQKKGEFIESFSSGIILGRPATPDDLSGLASFLASSDSDYLTGQIIMCDGGMVLV